MSGGHFKYRDASLLSEITDCGSDLNANPLEDRELSALLIDILQLVHDYDWYASGDTSRKDWVTAKDEFKDKWFKQDRNDRLSEIIQKRLDEVADELKEML